MEDVLPRKFADKGKYCNNTLPRGGMYWKIRPPEDQDISRSRDFAPRGQSQGSRGAKFAPRGPRDWPRAKPGGDLKGQGVQIAKGGVFFPIHPDSRQCIAILFPEQECIGNYIPISWLVLTVYGFNTLLLYKKRMEITPQLAG